MLLPLGLLLLVVLAVVARPLFVIAMVLAALAAVVAAFNPRFRVWLDARLDEQTHYKGLRLAGNIALHSSHSWACCVPRGVLVGADDLMQAALGPVDKVELPAIGQRVEQGDPLFVLRRGNRSLEVRSPITGTVVARNELLDERPGVVNDDPFRGGWAVRLRDENLAAGKDLLRRGKKARTWFQSEVDRFVASLRGEEHVEVSMADGGAVVGDLYRHIDDRAWQHLTERFFVPKTEQPS